MRKRTGQKSTVQFADHSRMEAQSKHAFGLSARWHSRAWGHGPCCITRKKILSWGCYG